MYKKTLIPFFVTVILISGIALADDIMKVCLTDNILQVNTTFNVIVNNNNTNIITSKNIYCPYGCNYDKNDCNDAPLVTLKTVPTSIAFGIIIFVIGMFMMIESWISILKAKKGIYSE
jgi:hypothetical protein